MSHMEEVTFRATLMLSVSHVALLAPSMIAPRVGRAFDPRHGLLFYPRYPY